MAAVGREIFQNSHFGANFAHITRPYGIYHRRKEAELKVCFVWMIYELHDFFFLFHFFREENIAPSRPESDSISLPRSLCRKRRSSIGTLSYHAIASYLSLLFSHISPLVISLPTHLRPSLTNNPPHKPYHRPITRQL